VRRLLAATVLSGALFAGALLGGAATAPAAKVGANDDSGKYAEDAGAAMYAEMAQLGLRQVVIPVRFKPSDPLTIQDKPLLDRTIPAALHAGLEVVIAAYPYPPRELEAGIGTPSLFGSYVGAVAEVYPEVKQFTIGNEPNQPAFWRPQFGSGGRNVSAAAFGQYLATAYDALKAADPKIEVAGVGLSPRGNDRPDARDNISTSPVRFLRALGVWYRASGRTKPLMDAFGFHPYPSRATDPLDRGYSWPNAGFANLDRIKQALWDAFQGTPQPTTLQGLELNLDEVGWQVGTPGRAGYTGVENVPVTDELTQAQIYAELIRRAQCDPDVAQVSFFGFRDDAARAGFQAGLDRLDGTPRPAADAVRAAIAATAGGCSGLESHWAPGAQVVGAHMAVSARKPTLTVKVGAGEDAWVRVCAARPGTLVGASAIASLPRSACRRAVVPGLRALDLTVPVPPGSRRRVEVRVDLHAESNRRRRTHFVKEALLRR
jgi:hypothetical protein